MGPMPGLDLPENAYQRLLARVDVFEEAVWCSRFDEGQVVSSYEVSAEGLAAAFAGVRLGTGLLPRECLFYGRAGGEERIGVWVRPQVRELAVSGAGAMTAPLRVPIPGLVFVGQGRRYWVWAVKQRPGAEGERLYLAPFPNVFDDGRICPGDVDLPACSAGTVHDAAGLFLGSVFTDHLRQGKCASEPEDVRALWRSLEGKRRFPGKELVRARVTVGEVAGGV